MLTVYRQIKDSFYTKRGALWFGVLNKDGAAMLTAIERRNNKDTAGLQCSKEAMGERFGEFFEKVDPEVRVYEQIKDSMEAVAGTTWLMIPMISDHKIYHFNKVASISASFSLTHFGPDQETVIDGWFKFVKESTLGAEVQEPKEEEDEE